VEDQGKYIGSAEERSTRDTPQGSNNTIIYI